jgi:hypothetical protein
MAVPFSLLPQENILQTLKPVRPWAFLGSYVVSCLVLSLGLGLFLIFRSLWLLPLVLIGILLLVATYYYSGAFTYYLTNKRIVIYRKFITISTRQIQYDDLSDVVVDVGIIGRIVGFGNVIPVTKSGLGLGTTGWHAGAGYGRIPGPIVVGGPSSTTVRAVASPSTCIYGVRDPFSVKDLIFKYQEEYAEAPYLKRIAEKVEEKPKALAGVKFCPFCGSKLVEGAKFCASCGKKIQAS